MSKLGSGAKSLFNIAANAAKGIDQSVPEEVSKERHSICEGCPKRTVTGQCSECLCFTKAKVLIRQEACPLDKWSKWEPDSVK